ncbi:MAG TPA: GNAT family N-acetyltransferase [Dehalococcoidia bacterium]|nr:GNAT family N-acetyltransferase [Dehalococcoidia bacterium]
MHPGEEDAVCRLIEDSFNEFVAPDYSNVGVKEFFKYANPQSLKDRAQKNHFVFVASASDADKLAGVIEIRENNHVSLLFVKTEYQNLGIAKKLLELSLERCRKANPSLDHIDVNSSPYAVKIYERLGFKTIGMQQEVNGIRFTPMKLLIK